MTQFVFRTREQVLEHFVPQVAQRKIRFWLLKSPILSLFRLVLTKRNSR